MYYRTFPWFKNILKCFHKCLQVFHFNPYLNLIQTFSLWVYKRLQTVEIFAGRYSMTVYNQFFHYLLITAYYLMITTYYLVTTAYYLTSPFRLYLTFICTPFMICIM